MVLPGPGTMFTAPAGKPTSAASSPSRSAESGVAESGFSDPKEGGIPSSVAKKVKVSVATLNPESYPPEGQEFFTQFEQEYGEDNPDPYAIYGYETMALALDTLKQLGDKANDKAAVVEQLVGKTKGRDSVLGTYDIDENGDTTLTDYGVYKVGSDGDPTFEKTIKAGSS